MNTARIYCSFCGKSDQQVSAIIAGEGAAICKKCIVECCHILMDDEKPKRDAIVFRRESLLIEAPGGIGE